MYTDRSYASFFPRAGFDRRECDITKTFVQELLYDGELSEDGL